MKICMQTKPCTKIEKEEIKSHDFVSEPQKLEFCVDMSTCQGVCLSFAPSPFLVIGPLKFSQTYETLLHIAFFVHFR